MLDYLLSIGACILAVVGYIIYYRNIKESGITFNRLTWVIASITVSLETITYCAVSGNFVKSLYFIVCSVCVILITIKVWKSAIRTPFSQAQKYSLAFYSVAIALWPLFDLPYIAHLLLLIVIPLSFFPVYKSAYLHFKTEESLPWLLWSVSDLLVIVIIWFNIKTLQELPYAIVSFICPFTVYAIIIFQRIRYAKTPKFLTAA